MPKSLGSARHRWLAAQIAQERIAAGMTQAEVAARLGRHQPLIHNIETGQRRVDLIELLLLGEIIGFDVHELVEQLRGIN